MRVNENILGMRAEERVYHNPMVEQQEPALPPQA